MHRDQIDPELKYCPQCGDEYQAEIRTCVECDQRLVLGREILAAAPGRQAKTMSPAKIEAGDAVVSIRKGPMLQIKELQATVQRHGLPARILKEEGQCGCRGPEVSLQVREIDLQAVMAVLAEEYRQTTGLADHDTRFAGAVFDDQHEEAVCPACGCRFSTQLTICPDCGLCFA